MASPVVAEVIENSTATAGANHTINHPTVVAGQLWVIILDKGSTSATVNAHADWTELLDEALANGLYIAYRWTTGTEGASTTLVTSANTRTASMVYRITGAENPATTAPGIATTGTGTSATPDPPSITPPSSKDYLFIAFYGAAGEEADDDTWSDTPPTNYTPSPPRQKACGIAGSNLGGLIAAAERALTTGAAEDPGTFAKDVSVAWRSQTIIVHPSTSVAYDITVADTLTLADSVTAAAGWDRTVADTLTLADAIAAEFQKSLADTLTLADSATAERGVAVSVDDTLALADSVAFETGKEANIADTLALSDSVSLEVSMTLADALALADSLSNALGFNVSVADVLALSDTVTAERGIEVTIADTLGGGAAGPAVSPELIHIRRGERLAKKVTNKRYEEL